MNDNYVIKFEDIYKEAFGTGPFSVHNRYVTEDVPVGCRVFHELGKRYGIPTPTVDTIIQLASIMTEHDYFNEGYTLEHLGIAHLDEDALYAYLTEGVIA